MQTPTIKKNQEQLNRLKPSYIGRTCGVSLWECPVYGDETTMLTKIDGIWFDSGYMELEDIADDM
jgi:hypothetical protein